MNEISDWLQAVGPGWAAAAAVTAVLAAARLTRLITLDEISRPIRDWVFRRLDENRAGHRMLAYAIECGWCAAVWVSAGLVGGWALLVSVDALGGAAGGWAAGFWLVLASLALSQLAGMLVSVSSKSGS